MHDKFFVEQLESVYHILNYTYTHTHTGSFQFAWKPAYTKSSRVVKYFKSTVIKHIFKHRHSLFEI